ncbi:MAG: TrkH family potassium uptake protein, partial [Candidatus Omnitrophica bacterium]|nr:TrkH family potassium uptake protein [Candidatus Omnitrophota bacterium]
EITSGFTTTGSSVISDVEILPRGILFWRSLTHWIGGMGIVVLYIALLPALGGNNFQLYRAEASGLTVDKTATRIKDTARTLWLVYIIISMLSVILLLFGGMSFFDSLCHTFGAVATGGYSTKNLSMAAYSPYLQWVIFFVMFAGGINFILHYHAFKGKPFNYFKDEEFRFYCAVLLVNILIVAGVLYHDNLSQSPIRDAAFQVMSLSTSTGFATTDFNLWPDILKYLLLLSMIFGGCGGSTSAGIKQIRLLLTFKSFGRAAAHILSPNSVVPVKINNKPLSDNMMIGLLTFFALYVFTVVIGVYLLLVFESCDLMTAVSAAVTTVGGVGPGFNKVGPMANFGWMTDQSKWVLSFLMLAGRVELYTMFLLFSPVTWKK